MKARLAITRIILLAVVLGMAGLAGLGYVLQRSDLKTLQDLSKENIMWNAAQLEIELHRFLGALGRVTAGDEDVTTDDIIDRFDILWSRAAIFETGDVATRLNAYDEDRETIASLFTVMRAEEDAVMDLAEGDMAAIRNLMMTFQPYASKLRGLSIAVVKGEEIRIAASRSSIRDGSFMASMLSLGALIMSAMLIGVVYIEARKYRRLADHNARLAYEADQANQAKSRFLTMMSHELRTPMNGVLGQLALAKLPGLPKPQLKLVEQAERSGRQMIGMLTDILDFSALQENTLAIDRRAFRLGALAQTLNDLFSSHAQIDRPPPTITCEEDTAYEVIGDAQRIRQSIAHLVTYVVDTAGTSDIRVNIGYYEGEAFADISFAYESGAASVWRPEMLLGEPRRGAGQFASDALGPMVARGLIDGMGGRIDLTELSGERTAVRVSIPAEVVRRTRPLVLLEAGSVTMRMICEAALRDADVDLAAPGADAGKVDVALVEVSPGDEYARLEELRRLYPRARIIAIGKPAAPEIYDDVTPMPIRPDQLKSALIAEAA